MAIPVGRTLYKKKDGILTLTGDQQTVTWTPNAGGPPTVSLSVANITNLQQTPDTAAKVMLKIFEKPATEGGDATPYLFHFNTSEARVEAKAVKDLLSRLLADLRANDASVPKPRDVATPNANGSSGTGTPAANGSGGVSGSMAFANAANAQPDSNRWFDDTQLKNNIELQQSLMTKDIALYKTYMAALSTKPESISGAAFNSQFWSTRTNLLRSHAIEINQKKGAYNVLSTIKPRTENDEVKLSMSAEQVQMIFAQHPLVKRIYNENVPKMSEIEFWSDFFLSRLAKQLRGERVTEADQRYPVFDRYDPSENTQSIQSLIMAQSVPHIIDLEANEENQGGFKGGNRKDVEMRPRRDVPIVRTLNSLSERIMANVNPSDKLNTEGDDGATNQLSLRDLRGDAAENRIILNVREQNQFFSSKNKDAAPSRNAQLFAKQKPSDVLFSTQADLETLVSDRAGCIDLHAGIGFADESDSDEEGDQPAKKAKTMTVGSRAAIKAAEAEIFTGIRQQRAQHYSAPSSTANPDIPGLTPELSTECSLTHATTVEFLHQFWTAFLSGDPDRAAELSYLAESLARSLTRIDAVADEADKEREQAIKRRKTEIRDYYERTGTRIRWKADNVGGGKDAVMGVMAPIVDAVARARSDYERALKAEGLAISTEAT